MSTPKESTRYKRSAQFMFVIIAIALVWLIVLPNLGQTAPMREIIDRNRAGSIDPSALFYSDLEHLHYDRGMLRHNPATRTGGTISARAR